MAMQVPTNVDPEQIKSVCIYFVFIYTISNVLFYTEIELNIYK